VTVSGKTPQLTLDLSGASKLSAENLKTETVNADIRGSSNARVHCTRSLTGDVSGASRLGYKGTPTELQIDTSDVGKVEKL